MRTCSIEGCERKVRARSWCAVHYSRWRRNGNPLVWKCKIEIHGKRKTLEYKTWTHMKERCYNPKILSYKYYGGRGITVCERWRDSFIAFLEDMGERPFPKAEIDRIDNDGNYEPINCRWTTRTENRRNCNITKLTMEKANLIRKLYAEGNQTMVELGDAFGVSNPIISRIVNNAIWN